MGAVCAKNDAGKVATDAPKQNIKRQERSLMSTQGAATAGANKDAQYETKFIDSMMNFNLDKGVDKKADALAEETAKAWCSKDLNSGWSYTNVWKNERSKADSTKEVSLFEVRKMIVTAVTGGIKLTNAEEIDGEDKKMENGDVAPVELKEDAKILEEGTSNGKERAGLTDKKQSFVDQVAEGLAAKVSSDRFVEEEKKDVAACDYIGVDGEEKEEPVKAEVTEDKKDADVAPTNPADTKPNPAVPTEITEAEKSAADADKEEEAKIDEPVADAPKDTQEESKAEEPAEAVEADNAPKE